MRLSLDLGLGAVAARNAGDAAAPVLPANDLFASWGDSKTEQGIPTAEVMENNGYQFWGAALALGRSRTSFALNFATAGDTLAQMAAKTASVVASEADTVVLLGGSNSVANDVTLSTMITQMSGMISDCRDAGKVVVLANETPKGGADFPDQRFEGARLATLSAFRDWCETQHSPSRGVYLWDSWRSIYDPANPTDNLAGTTRDGLHPSTYGAYLMGKSLADVFAQLWDEDLSFLPADAADTRLLSTNPYMTGTGGTLNTGGSGSLATDYTFLRATGAAGATAAYSKEAGDVQRVVLGGTPAGTAAIDLGRQIGLQANWDDGTYVEAVLDCTIQPGTTSLRSVKAGVSITANAVTTWYTGGDESSNAGDILPSFPQAERLIIRVPRVLKPALLTDLRLRPGSYPLAAVPIALDMTINCCALMQHATV